MSAGWGRYRTPSAFSPSTFLCDHCATKRGLTEADLIRPADPDELPLDCHGCGRVLREVGA